MTNSEHSGNVVAAVFWQADSRMWWSNSGWHGKRMLLLHAYCLFYYMCKKGWLGGEPWVEAAWAEQLGLVKPEEDAVLGGLGGSVPESIDNFCAKSPLLVFFTLTPVLHTFSMFRKWKARNLRQEIRGKQTAVVNGIALRRVLSCRPTILAWLGMAIVSIPLPGSDSPGVFQRVKKQPACPLLSQAYARTFRGREGR